MSSAVLALSWELVARFRWFFALTCSWLLFLCVLGLALPQSVRSPELGGGLAVTIALPLLFVLGALMHGVDARLEERRSGFPSRLFTLPVSSVVLAGPALVLPTIVLFVCWGLCDLCLLKPFGIDAPLFWPPLCFAATFVLMQALTWLPFPLPYLRLVCIVILLLGLYSLTIGLVALEVRESVLSLLYGSLLVLGYAVALVGVTKGRRGVGVREAVRIGAVPVSAHQRSLARPFSSHLRAQLWLEWRLYGWVFVFFGALCLVLILPSIWVLDFGLRQDARMYPWFRPLREAVGDSWVAMTYLLTVPFLLSLVNCGQMNRSSGTGSGAIPPFLATRPISTPDMVKAKLLNCVLGVCCAWGIVLLGVLTWVIFMGRVEEMTDKLIDWTGSGVSALGVFVGGLLLLLALTWLWMVQGMWAGLFGRLPLMAAPLCFGLIFCGVLVGLMIHWQAEWLPVLLVGIGFAVVAKALAITWVSRKLLLERFIRLRTLAFVLGAWVAFAGGVIAIALLSLPDGNAPLTVGIAILQLPLARCLAAPLALARNRSR